MTISVLQVLGRSAGGIARHVADITASLDGSDGLAIDVAGPSDLPVAMPKAVRELTIPDGLLGHRKIVQRLRAIAAGYDVVHAHGLRAGIDSALAVRGSPTPVFVTIHNLVRADIAGPLKAPLYRRSERLVVGLADRVFCVSRDIAEHLESTAPRHASKIEVAYLGIDEPPPPARSREEIRAELGVDSGRLVVTASRLSPQKALPVMFEALSGLEGCFLAILGEGPQRAELEELAGRKLPGRVRFLGFRSDAVDYIRAGDLFCLSSVWEGIPLAAQEAIFVGTPVVATDVGGMRELVTDRKSGRLVPKNDPLAMRDALREVLEAPNLAQSYASHAKEHLEVSFGRAQMLRHLAEAYRGAARAR